MRRSAESRSSGSVRRGQRIRRRRQRPAAGRSALQSRAVGRRRRCGETSGCTRRCCRTCSWCGTFCRCAAAARVRKMLAGLQKALLRMQLVLNHDRILACSCDFFARTGTSHLSSADGCLQELVPPDFLCASACADVLQYVGAAALPVLEAGGGGGARPATRCRGSTCGCRFGGCFRAAVSKGPICWRRITRR